MIKKDHATLKDNYVVSNYFGWPVLYTL